MQQFNKYLYKADKVYDNFNGGDIRRCYKGVNFSYRGESFHLIISYEESLGVPFNEDIGFLKCDVKSSFTVTRYNSKSRKTGLMFSSLKDVHPDGNDNDPEFISEKRNLEKAVKFTVKDLDLATDRRTSRLCDLVIKMWYGE